MSEIGYDELRGAEDRVMALLKDVNVSPEEMNWTEAGEAFLQAYEDLADLQGQGSERVRYHVSRARTKLYEVSEACGDKDFDAMKREGSEAAYCLNQAWHALQRGA